MLHEMSRIMCHWGITYNKYPVVNGSGKEWAGKVVEIPHLSLDDNRGKNV